MEDISLNTLISKILIKYLEWDTFVHDMGFVFCSKRFIRTVLDKLNQNDIVQLAKNVVGPSMRDATIFLNGGEFSYQGFAKTLQLWLEHSDIQFRIYEGDGTKYVIQHQLGKKWPKYFICSIEDLCSDLGYGLKNLQESDSSLTFTVFKPTRDFG